MKIAVIITSIIDVDNTSPLTYSKVRSFFNSKERLEQTNITLNALNRVLSTNDCIYLIDASSVNTYAECFISQTNLKYIDVKTEFPEIHQEVVTHPHKTRCECLMLSTFIEKFKSEMDQYDAIYKISGRYFFDDTVQLNTDRDKIYFKYPQCFQWKDEWGLQYLDRREIQQDNALRQYSTVLFGWGNTHNAVMLSIFKKIANTVIEPGKANSDMETLIYFFTRPLESYIIESNWTIYGWNGTNGNFINY